MILGNIMLKWFSNTIVEQNKSNFCFRSITLHQEFLEHWNFWGTEYSYKIYDNGTNQSSTMNILEYYKKCNFREFDYNITAHVIRYIYDICLVYNFPSLI